jgi:putative hydrolase of the HAD superfamily
MTFVYFDLDRTLIDHDSAERQAVQQFHERFHERIDESKSGFVTRWREVAERFWEQYHEGTISYWQQKRERVRTLLDRDEDELPDEEADEILNWYLKHYKAACELFPDARNCLDQLREVVDLGILTNGGKDLQYDKLQRTEIMDYFDPIVCSDQVGIAKPNEGIFQTACRRADRDPAEVIYIGDSVELDVTPANQYGMTGIWLNRTEETAAASSSFQRLTSLEGFPQLVLDQARPAS